jgi:hypothetical protein
MNLIYDFRVAPNSFDIATFIANGYLYSRIKGEKIDEITFIQLAFRPEPSWGTSIVPPDYEKRKVDTVAYAIARLVSDSPSISIYTDFNALKSAGALSGFPDGFNPLSIPENAYSTKSLLPCNEVHTNQLYSWARVPPYPFKPNRISVDEVLSRWGPRYATLSIRNSIMNKSRNDVPELVKSFRAPLKNALAQLGIRLVLVPDRENVDASDPINMFDGEDVDVEAAFSVDRRFALYSESVMNISPSVGPNILLALSPYPYFIFNALDESVPIMSRQFFARKGPAVGFQRPWANHRQWLDWGERQLFDGDSAIKKIVRMISSGAAI